MGCKGSRSAVDEPTHTTPPDAVTSAAAPTQFVADACGGWEGFDWTTDGEGPRKPLKVAETELWPSGSEVKPRIPRTDDAPVLTSDAASALALAEVAVGEALRVCRAELDRGNVFAAERALMAALEPLTDPEAPCAEVRRAAAERLRATGEYRSTLSLLTDYERSVEKVLAAEGASAPDGAGAWLLSSEVPVNYQALELELGTDLDASLAKEDRVISVYWRQGCGRLEIRMQAVLPTRPANATRPLLAGWVAMNVETELYDTWHPIVAEKGPREMVPRGPYRNLWQFMTKILLYRVVELQEERMFFNHETGAHVMVVEDFPEGHELWDTHPAPKKFKINPNTTTLRVVALTQEDRTFFGVHLESGFDHPPPATVLKLMISWVCPEVVRRLLRTGARCLRSDGPYAEPIQADSHGLYAECESLVESARARDREAGCTEIRFGSKKPPTADRISARAKSLTKFDAAQAVDPL